MSTKCGFPNYLMSTNKGNEIIFLNKIIVIQDSIPGSLNLNARGGCHKYGAINDVTSVGRGSIQDVNPMRCNL